MSEKTQMWHVTNNGTHATSTTELMVRVFIFIAALAIALSIFTPNVIAANDPGHDTLYLLRGGDNVTGNFRIVGNLNVTILYDADNGVYYLNPASTSNLNTLTLGTDLAVADGGTGGSTNTNARVNLAAAMTGNCSVGMVVQNTTTSGVQCVSVGSGNGSVTSIAAGTGLTGGTITTTGTIALNSTGVTASSYGGAASVGNFVVDANGRITSASNVSIVIAASSVSGLNSSHTHDAANITSGTLAVARGGTAAASFTAYSVIAAGTTATGAFQSVGAGSSGQVLRSGGASALPAWSTATYPATASSAGQILRADGTNWVATTATYPATTTAGQLLYSSAASTVTGLASLNSGVVVTNSTGFPNVSTDLPTAVTIGNAYVYRVSGTDVAIADGGTGASTNTNARVNLAAAMTGNCSVGMVVQNTTTSGVQCVSVGSGNGSVTSIAAGTGLTGGTITTTGTIALNSTGVTASSYGGTVNIGNFVVDANGRITSASNTTIRSGTTAVTGIVQLTDSTSSTSTTTAATPNSVKTAYDLANGKASVGTCGSGQAVQNTTTGGVQCVSVLNAEVDGSTSNELQTISGDSGSTSATTITIAGGTDGIDTSVSGSTLTIAIDSSELPDDDVNESKLNLTTACASTSKLYVSGTNFACNADDDTPDSDSEVPDAITVSGGTIGSNSVSGTWTTTADLNIGDYGDRVNIFSNTIVINSGVITGAEWNGVNISSSYIANSSYWSAKAGAGTCGSGQVVQNTTSSGVQCVTVGGGLSGGGDTGALVKFNSSTTIGGSVISQSGVNVGIGVTTPSHKLELVNHTTAAGGIGIGSDVELYRSAANTLVLASGDSMNVALGSIQFAGTDILTSTRLVQTANGSASAPAHSFSADTNTGMYGTADVIGFATGGTSRATIASTGINIGTGNLTFTQATVPVLVGFQDITTSYLAAPDITLRGADNFEAVAGHVKILGGEDDGSVARGGSVYVDGGRGADYGYVLLATAHNSINVGVGATTPTAKLEVNGAIKINSTGTMPTCTGTGSAQRGTLWINQSASGVADKFYACMKNSTNFYNWVQVAIG